MIQSKPQVVDNQRLAAGCPAEVLDSQRVTTIFKKSEEKI
jgi:hypothetical protein